MLKEGIVMHVTVTGLTLLEKVKAKLIFSMESYREPSHGHELENSTLSAAQSGRWQPCDTMC